jgi:hypothetical protein
MPNSRPQPGKSFSACNPILVSLTALLLLCSAASAQAPVQTQEVSSETASQNSSQVSSSKDYNQGRLLFGKNFLRGYGDFELAPPHNEPDLGRCNQPQPTCSAFARYIIGGYIEFQPFARTPLKHAYFFFQPNFFFGNNIPQVKYTYSMAPLAWERTMGLAIQLPKHFELRVTNHGVTSFSPFDQSLGAFDSGPNKEPLGIYNTIGIRWYFGGYDHSATAW